MSTAHVVMLVGNDISVDTRVKKTAASLHRLGYRVTLLGYGAHGRETSRIAGCEVLRVPIPWTHKERGRILPGHSPHLPSDARSRAVQSLGARRAAVIDWGTRPSGSRPVFLARKFTKLGALQTIRVARKVVVTVLPEPAPAPVETPARRADEPELSLPWRDVVPIGLDYTEAFTQAIIDLAPDVIHAHDVHTIGAAYDAAQALRADGRVVQWIYDAHEYVAGLSLYGRRDAIERAGWLNMEQEFAPSADIIITVSPVLAEELQARYPQVGAVEVVLNAPWAASGASTGGERGVRAAAGVGPGVPLLVYSGVVTDARGVATAVAAMPHLPGVHLAVVSTTFASPMTTALATRAAELGVADRVHVLPPVPADQVVAHLASADVGLIPIRRFASHDVALTNKLFEYIHAGLPVVVSDCPAQKRFVRQEDIGTVHITDDPQDLALAVREVLRALDGYRERVRRPELAERYSWQASERRLGAVYSRLLAERPQLIAGAGDAASASATFPDLSDTDVVRVP